MILIPLKDYMACGISVDKVHVLQYWRIESTTSLPQRVCNSRNSGKTFLTKKNDTKYLLLCTSLLCKTMDDFCTLSWELHFYI